MAQQIIGLDIGSYAVKVAVFESGIRGYAWIDHHVWRVPVETPFPDEAGEMEAPQPAETEEETTRTSGEEETGGGEAAEEPPRLLLSPAVQKILEEMPVAGDRMVTAMPGNRVSNHPLVLPFTERKKIEDVLYFSLENLIPFDIEEIVAAYETTAKKKGESRLLTHIVLEETLAQFLQELRSSGIDPDIVTADAAALFNLHALLPRNIAGPVAIVDVGHSKTTVTFVQEGSCKGVRVIPMAGRMLTERLAAKMNLSLEEAEACKHHVGLVAHDADTVPPGSVSEEELEISAFLEEGLAPLAGELVRTFHRFTVEAHQRPVKVFLCGGSAELRNFPAFLQEALGIPVEPLEFYTQPFNKVVQQFPQGAAAVSLGLALQGVGGKNVSPVNFRQGEFAFYREKSEIRALIRSVAVMAMILLLLVGADTYVRYSILREKIARLNETTLEIFQSIAPDVSFKPGDFNRNMVILESAKARIDKQLEVIWGDTRRPITPLDLLKEFSERIPEKVVEEGEERPLTLNVDEMEFRMNERKVIIEGETDSFPSVDRIVEALETSEVVEKINAKPERGVKPDSVKFKLTITLKTADDAQSEDA
ncbi:MAG: hypothetical protein D6795_19095 [Deltaproteobacteria bacterium]|nr:MAG: hypothetical protein D6795_19095 [Deltaproteobacteria bacterium]